MKEEEEDGRASVSRRIDLRARLLDRFLVFAMNVGDTADRSNGREWNRFDRNDGCRAKEGRKGDRRGTGEG